MDTYYRLYSPKHNAAIRQYLLAEIAVGRFPPEVMIRCVFFPPGGTPLEGLTTKQLVNEEYYRGFLFAMSLFQASLILALDTPTSQVLANNKLLLFEDDDAHSFFNLGKGFLPTGRSLILQDMSGKKLMTAISKELQSQFRNQDFRSGLDSAQRVFFDCWEHWRHLENRPAP